MRTYLQSSLILLFGIFTLCCVELSAAYGYESASTADIREWSKKLEKSDGIDRAELLLKRGEAYRSLGYYPDAERDLTEALTTLRQSTPSVVTLEIAALQSLGYLRFLMQNIKEAEIMLRTALKRAEQLVPPAPALYASCANHLGNLLAGNNRPNEALEIYQKALNSLDKKRDLLIEATIHRNIAHILTERSASFDHLDTAAELATQLTPSSEKAKLLLDIAAESSTIEAGQRGDKFIYPLLDQALATALKLNDHYLISLASGQLGALYESRDRISEANTLTEQAVTSALMVQSHELLLQWQWQWGRLLRREGEQKKSIAAYQRALFHVEAIRQEMPVKDNRGCSSFRERLSPIYRELAEMLLKESGAVHEKSEEQQLLREAQQALESVKQSELRDYFKDPCIDAMRHDIRSLSPSTAVIYPVILPDRLELLADIGGTLYRKTTAVKKEELERAVTNLASNLRNGLFYEEAGRQVYGWIVEPLQSVLDGQSVDTLIFVPDGVFRMIPASALWSGEEFLAQKYAVVTEPALTLLDPSPLPEGQRTTLLAGISRPGPVVLDLPNNLWNQLSKADISSVNRKIRGVSVKPAPPAIQESSSTADRNLSIRDNGPSSSGYGVQNQTPQKGDQDAVEKVKIILSLPGVDNEIADLSKNLHGQTIMNSDFLLERFAGEIREKSYRIVHVASHGFFGGSPEENFIMTYDKILNMNLLEEYIKPKQFADLPVELLTLSACQTAEGDERSPLGLSGVALKSGARSVLGSLWPVSDSATQVLLSSFYENLNQSGTSKARALQKAQLELIQNREFNHPFYWSAFILVGNWL